MQAKLGKFVMVCGPLPRDAEYKRVGDKQTPLCKFGVKVDERTVEGKEYPEAVWCNCTCWRGVADAADGLRKGDVVLAVGKLETRTHNEREYTELNCEAVFLMGSGGAVAAAAPISAVPPDDFEEIFGDDELPF